MQNCSPEFAQGAGETILVSLANSGKVSSQPIDMDDDYRYVFGPPLHYSATFAASPSAMTAERCSETVDSTHPVNGRPFYPRTTVLLI
jgi:hypothetical protein